MLGETTDTGLARRLGIPKGTISTWLQRDTTPFEISIIVHLATGLSLRWLLLDEGEPFSSETNTNESVESISISKILNGTLVDDSSISIDLLTLERYGLHTVSTKVIDHDGIIHFVNTLENNPTVGRYLISIDGNISINRIQRLPGKKLAMSFGDSTIEISDEDIDVVGRIVMTMEKE
ncbi:hypothetical protein AYY19_11685 [Photobacterium aquimaris]|nr:hypothetical protein AYY20_05175 [Photobacterium aquimaris]OBU17884.1 hypothetical protein AYY19_11685 [Photobacterium aquimaris]